jgi:predicted  nucleic acid-binding Zn-ribbon protein
MVKSREVKGSRDVPPARGVPPACVSVARESGVPDRARTLYELQQTDHQLAADRQRLVEVERALADESRVEAAQAEVSRLEAELRQTQIRQRELEVSVAAAEQEIKRLSDLLYGGRVRNVRELQSIQHELEYQQQRKSEYEDGVLEAMERIEQLTADLDQARMVLEQARRQRELERAALTAERDRLVQELTVLEQRRSALAGSLEPAVLATYERLKGRTGGTPVAEVVQGRCSGCRLVLPAMDVQRARRGQELVHCQSCGRVLYIER